MVISEGSLVEVMSTGVLGSLRINDFSHDGTTTFIDVTKYVGVGNDVLVNLTYEM